MGSRLLSAKSLVEKNFFEKTLEEAANISISLLSEEFLKLNLTFVGDNASTLIISAKSCLSEGIPFFNKILWLNTTSDAVT